MECRFRKCLHDSREITDDDFVKVGSGNYHKDCFCVKCNINKINDLFLSYVRGNTIQSQLQKIIDEIVFEEGKNPLTQSKFLYFALEMYISQRKPLRYPAGLRYVIKNKDIIDAWELKKSRFFVDDDKIVIDEELEQTDKALYKPLTRSVSRIIKKGGSKSEDNK